jgi:pimeloyl-ACP methyl ester carboxylesterase
MRSIIQLVAALLSAAATLSAVPASAAGHADVTQFKDLQVTSMGQGRPVVMIPGLDASSAIWKEACDKLQPGVRCLMVQLPGFAGSPPVATDNYLGQVRDELLAYLATLEAGRVTVMGHSLGGDVALMMAVHDDSHIDRLILLDALPFLPALEDPSMTAARATPMARETRDEVLKSTPAQDETKGRAMLAGMVHGADRTDQLLAWGRASDRATRAEALYELMTTDLRPRLPAIHRPTLVLGAWAAYAKYGATKDSSRQLYQRQYAGLADLTLKFSDAGFHVLEWDDTEWVARESRAFMNLP